MGAPVNFYSRTGITVDDLYLLLHGNGTDASTDIIDSSTYANIVTIFDNIQIDTAQSVFGGSSLLFDGTGYYLTIPNTVRTWNFFGSLIDSWTIDFRLRFPDDSVGLGFFRIRDNDNNVLSLYFEPSFHRLNLTVIANGFFLLQRLRTSTNSITRTKII